MQKLDPVAAFGQPEKLIIVTTATFRDDFVLVGH